MNVLDVFLARHLPSNNPSTQVGHLIAELHRRFVHIGQAITEIFELSQKAGEIFERGMRSLQIQPQRFGADAQQESFRRVLPHALPLSRRPRIAPARAAERER